MDIETLNKQLDYLKETKNLMANAIYNKGVDVLDEDTFRDYVQKINSIQTSSNLWQTQVSITDDLVINTDYYWDLSQYPEFEGPDVNDYATLFHSNDNGEIIGIYIIRLAGITEGENGNKIRWYDLIEEYKGIDTSEATATAKDIFVDKVAYNSEGKVTGTLANYGGGLNTGVEKVTPNTGYDGTFIEFRARELQGPFGFSDDSITITMTPRMSVVSEGIGLTADVLKQGVTILDIEGTYEGDYSETLTPEEYDAAVAVTDDILGTTEEK